MAEKQKRMEHIEMVGVKSKQKIQTFSEMSNISNASILKIVENMRRQLQIISEMPEQSPDLNQITSNFMPGHILRQMYDGEPALRKDITKKKTSMSKTEHSVSYRKMLFTFANKRDKFLISLGFMFAILCGIGMPSQLLLYADIIDSFAQDDKHKILQ